MEVNRMPMTKRKTKLTRKTAKKAGTARGGTKSYKGGMKKTRNATTKGKKKTGTRAGGSKKSKMSY